MVTTIAGNGTAILATNNSLAATGSIGAIRGLAAPSHGSLYFAECAPNLVATPMCFVERIRNGRIELVAGSVRESLDDGPATEVRLDRVFGLALGVNQALYISTSDRIRRISQGWVTTVVGQRRSAGDGYFATAAYFSELSGISTDMFGNVYVSDLSGQKIRSIRPERNGSYCRA